MMYDPIKNRLFIAVDESNHGRDEEIFVSSFSFNPHLANYKRGSSDVDVRGKEASRFCSKDLDYRFCVVNRDSYGVFGEHSIHKEVSRVFYNSLLEEFSDLDSVTLYLDGEFRESQREDIKLMLKKMTGMEVPYPAISVISVPKRNRGGTIKTNDLLLHADYMANRLFRASRFDTADKEGKYFKKRLPFPLQ